MTSSIPISIKYGNTIYHIHLDNQSDVSKSAQFDLIANHLHISSDRLKLIHKGKQYTKENWKDLILVSNMNFLSIGEQNEDETNVNTKDIERLMEQMKVDRNTAVKTLKLHPDIIDAILYLGNK
jgi:hypothetical protein